MAHTETVDRPRPAARGPQDDAQASAAAPAAGQQPRKRTRRRLFLILGLVILLAALAYGTYYFLVGSNYATTDDAYVDASVASITPEIQGTIISVPVNDTQHVKQGDVLVVLDPADAKLAVAQADAAYQQAIRRVQGYFANADSGVAQVAARQADVQRAEIDLQRRASLGNSGAVSGDELTTAKNALANAKAALAMSQQQLVAQRALISGADVNNNPEVLAAKANLDKAHLDLDRTTLRAPIDGIVAQNMVQIGQRVDVGRTLMTVVPVADAHVNANFKEGQLDRVHPGQPVEMTSDLYGSGVVFHGKVIGIGGGTGSAFAVIPAQNATGNWIKVVQRVPVRIALDPKELAEHPLRVGLSINASIDLTK